MDFNDLTEEQKAKVDGCKTPQELQELAKEEGLELSLEELDSISAGTWGGGNGGSGTPTTCPRCGSTNTSSTLTGTQPVLEEWLCLDCGYTWVV